MPLTHDSIHWNAIAGQQLNVFAWSQSRNRHLTDRAIVHQQSSNIGLKSRKVL
jgi:hypothetical protein